MGYDYEKTINYLSKTDINFKEVDLFLSDGEELDAYKESLKEYPINFIVTNKKHVNTQRNFIVDYYPVSMKLSDIFLVAITVLFIGGIASWYSAKVPWCSTKAFWYSINASWYSIKVSWYSMNASWCQTNDSC